MGAGTYLVSLAREHKASGSDIVIEADFEQVHCSFQSVFADNR